MSASNSNLVPEIEPDVILPEQYWDRPVPPEGGALSLLWMVFVDGIRSYQDALHRGATCGQDFRETQAWVLSSDTSHVTSFLTLCEVFGVNPTRLRLRLLGLREAAEQGWHRKAG
ncbi:MAG: hypothetical protein ACREQY_09385 [Candidatus Binatia bacterium]